jgi:hypothetical protein
MLANVYCKRIIVLVRKFDTGDGRMTDSLMDQWSYLFFDYEEYSKTNDKKENDEDIIPWDEIE